jgi:hypothetical protein
LSYHSAILAFKTQRLSPKMINKNISVNVSEIREFCMLT